MPEGLDSPALVHGLYLERRSVHLGSWCSTTASGGPTVGAFHFPPVHPGVLLPHLFEVLGDEFVEFLAA